MAPEVLNVLSVDVEDYYQVSAFDRLVKRDDWGNIPSRVVANTSRLLDLFDQRRVKATFFVLGWVGKHTLFGPALGRLMRALGGIPIERGAPHDVVRRTAELFRRADRLVLAIPPEGTRHKVEYWRSGFYHIALQGGVPIEIDGVIVGAVGVSGVKASDDEIIALAGVNALKGALS